MPMMPSQPQEPKNGTARKTTTKKKGAIIVIRHGERLDYVCRDYTPGAGKKDRGNKKKASKNWVPTTCQPWNPPLTRNGCLQAETVGKKVHEHIQKYDLPTPLLHVYSSPWLRCVQTSAALIRGYEEIEQQKEALQPKKKNHSQRKVKLEFALVESMNEDWYRSWCLLNASDSTWGYKKRSMPTKTIDDKSVHPKAKRPIQELFPKSSHKMNQLYHQHHLVLFGSDNDKHHTFDSVEKEKERCTSDDYLLQVAKAHEFQLLEELNKTSTDTTTTATTITVPPDMVDVVDRTYTSPYPPIRQDYQWNNFETARDQSERMGKFITQLAQKYPEETVVVVSHGGPVTHLFEYLTNKHWKQHGNSKYTCCSIYVHTSGNEEQDDQQQKNEKTSENGDKKSPLPNIRFMDILVNDSSHLEDSSAGEIKYV